MKVMPIESNDGGRRQSQITSSHIVIYCRRRTGMKNIKSYLYPRVERRKKLAAIIEEWTNERMNLFVPGAFKINTVAKIVAFYFTSFCFKLLPSNEIENRDCVWHMLDSPPFGSIVCTTFEPYIPLRNDERKKAVQNKWASFMTDK